MKWKDRMLFVLLAIFVLLVFKWYGPTRGKGFLHNVNVKVTTRRNFENVYEEEEENILDILKDEQNDSTIEWDSMHPWDLWQEMVSERRITHASKKYVQKILQEMIKSKLTKVDVGHKGTQLKAKIFLDGPEQQQIVFKPRRYDRGRILKGIYEGYDRHNGEIAAFHLDRLLGFYRAPPVVGRYIDLETEVLPFITKKLGHTFFKDDSGNVCFFGVCRYCRKEEPACAVGKTMEVSLTMWLPAKWNLGYKRHPYQRTYRKNKKASWEKDEDYCQTFTQHPPYDKGPRLLDIMDTAIFDFIIGNADRHHYEYFKVPSEEEGMLIHLDNGKSFGNPHHDEMSILAPIKQCCRLRQSTFDNLQKFSTDSNNQASLSQRLDKLLLNDPIYPVLTKDHLVSIDRRLKKIIDVLHNCFDKRGKENVLQGKL